MNLKKVNLKIATILPYKENYSVKNASAVSIWVSDFYKYSIFKKNNYIYGSTLSKKFLTKNYINISLQTISSKFQSTTKEYAGKLIKEIFIKQYDIIEIHNRPQLFNTLVNKFKEKKFILYFHNDPLTMLGSISLNERKAIYDNAEKLIFVSEWCKKRFFENLDASRSNKAHVIYPSIEKRKKIKKKKIITYVGKLNSSKGYDLFKDSIIKILDEFSSWKAFSIGDEDRRKIFINHKKHKELGYLKHSQTLNILDKSEIAIVPSIWNEPFGRVAMEAAACGCAVITSNKGGLCETSDHPIFISNINAKKIYKNLKTLIKNKSLRNKIQNISRKGTKHLINANTKKIDKIRQDIFSKFKINLNKNKLRIINLYNLGQKNNHRLYNLSLGKKFTNGFIRNNFDVLEISDRDFIKNSRNFLNYSSPKKKFQNYIIDVFKNYNPDLFFFGHTNNIDLDTLEQIKKNNKNLIISHWNEDPVMFNDEISIKNIANLNYYKNFVDHTFTTSHPSVLKKTIKNYNNLNFFFVPVDRNIECYDVYKLKPENDLFFAMSHGVNRGVLKKNKIDERIFFLEKLIKFIPNINYDFYGFQNKDPIWAEKFNIALVNSKMGLNLSRGKPVKYYSSNRIASLMGNGLLTFIDKKTQINEIFNNDEAIFYENIKDLSDKIKFYSKNESRIKIAKKGQKKYFKLFNEKKISKYFIDISIGKSAKIF